MNVNHLDKEGFKKKLSGFELPISNDDFEQEFLARLLEYAPELERLFYEIYGDKFNDKLLKSLLEKLTLNFSNRSAVLKVRDKMLSNEAPWYLDHKQVGMACYVDRFAKDLKGLTLKIPYLKDLGITFLHLLPLYQSPEGENDGGYAVSNYRVVNPELGDMEELRLFIEECNQNDIHVVLDFIFNHTSDEHKWAKRAIAGEKKYQDFYFLYDDRKVPDQFDPFLREIFPHVRRGSFSHRKDIDKWVWTTFNSYQWDLNYANPDVFSAVMEEMLFLANTGCDVLRLDALSFIWKDPETNCEGRPNTYKLIKALNLCLRIAAPSVIFKSEAIVHPDNVVKYIDPQRCQLSYNPLLMGLLWSSLATTNTKFINQSLSHRFAINQQCAWVNYVRCHDDIGWFFDDKDADRVGIELNQHLAFLNEFYTNNSVEHFPSGVSFQDDPSIGDQRLCGSLASLCGLEKAIEQKSQPQINLSIKRILLLHSVILSIGGIPLIYAGDEIGMLNDYSYLKDPTQSHDARWVNRPIITEQAISLSQQKSTPQNIIFEGINKMISIRKKLEVFGNVTTEIINTNNHHLFTYSRIDADEKLIAICNFSNLPQALEVDNIRPVEQDEVFIDLISEKHIKISQTKLFHLSAYQVMWLYKS